MSKDYEAHLYLDVRQATVAWNVARGGFCSPNILKANAPFPEDCLPLSFAARSHFGSQNRLVAECAIERLRKIEFPDAVSRLMGIFVFKTVDDIGALWEAEGWGGHFSDDYLADCGVQACRESRVDANWIPYIIDRDGNLADEWVVSARRYWQGEVAPGKPPIWETIVSGCVTIWGVDLKCRARLEISMNFENSLHALDYSEVCFDVGSLDGNLFPVATFSDEYMSVHDMYFCKDIRNSQFRSALRKGVVGKSNFIRRFENFDLIHWPKLDWTVRKIPLQEVERVLRAAKVI